MNMNSLLTSLQTASSQALLGVNAVGQNARAGSSESNPNDIPKEELMQLCMKMQKRMQAMEMKGKELVKKKASLLAERQRLLDIFVRSSPSMMDVPMLSKEDQELDLDAIEHEWKLHEQKRHEQQAGLEEELRRNEQRCRSLQQEQVEAEERHQKEIELERSLASSASTSAPSTNSPNVGVAGAAGVDPLLAPVSESSIVALTQLRSEADSLKSKLATLTKEKQSVEASAAEAQRRVQRGDAEVERLKGVEAYLKKQLRTLEGVVGEKNIEMEKLQKAKESSITAHEEKVLQLQMQLKSLRGKEEQREKDSAGATSELEKLRAQVSSLQRANEEKDMSVSSNRDMISSLQARLIELEPDLLRAQERVKELERKGSASAILKAEQDALLNSLRRDLKRALEEKDSLEQQVKDMEASKIKAEGQLMKLSALSEQVNILQASIEDKTSLITRMRSEAQASERNHAMRTAMLATCEAELDALKRQMESASQEAASTGERVQALQEQLRTSQAEWDTARAQLEEQLVQAQRLRDEEQQRWTAERAALFKRHEEEVEAIQRDHNKKSGMARTLLSEREEEVRVLSAKVQELQEEIASGAPSDRKIFELAATQSRRDAMHGVHSDTRELAFRQLQGKLASRDLELARVQQLFADLQAEAAELRRTRQRDGVNMDYLKNIVIQYMCFPNNTSEKMALVPVLAMLLQFSAKEVQQVQRAAHTPSAAGGLGLWGGGRTVKTVKPPSHPAPANTPAASANAAARGARGASPRARPPTGRSSSTGSSAAGSIPVTPVSRRSASGGSIPSPDTATMQNISITATPQQQQLDQDGSSSSFSFSRQNSQQGSSDRGLGVDTTLSESADAAAATVDSAYVQRALYNVPSFSRSDGDISDKLHRLGEVPEGSVEDAVSVAASATDSSAPVSPSPRASNRSRQGGAEGPQVRCSGKGEDMLAMSPSRDEVEPDDHTV